jgi:asparagine synthase (glutamine-hydrolysing)
MCGIGAIAGPRQRDGAIERMVASLAHRGPDAHATSHAAECELGHARLAIIDLTTGAQPMSDASARYSIAFNGEIYNFPELRKELERAGHAFRTTSDTEVLLEGYREWGRGLVDRLRGMFAFALWDSLERRLFAARDLFGEKPLYYADVNGTLVIASELKAIVASGVVTPALDLDSVDAFLALGYVPPDRTIYRGISTLPPAHTLEWHDGAVRVDSYWTPRFATQPIASADAAEQLRELLQRSVRRQMIADVTVGAFLSGGLDSSTIVAMMQQHTPARVMTFSAGFGTVINELPYARAVARQYGTDHHEVEMGEPDVTSLVQRMAEVYDEPFADSSNIPTYLISEYARQFVKVVLSGDGGDELFGGYGWYAPLLQSEKVPLALLQWVVWRAASKIARGNRAIAVRAHAAGLAARWDDVWERDVMSQTFFRPAHRAMLWAGTPVRSFSPEKGRPDASVTGLNRAFHFDLTSYLPGDILVKVDRAAMAHGLETRAPFLDRDLVEFALSLPANLKVRGMETKAILRDACRQYWPPELWDRPKQGFGAPVSEWLSMAKMQPLLDRIYDDASSPLRRLLPGVRASRKRARDARGWLLLTLGLWLEKRPELVA